MKKTVFALAALGILMAAPLALEAHGPSFRAKVWTIDGNIWTLRKLQDRSGVGEWRYWAAGESGVLLWDEVLSITFLENLYPNRYTRLDREIPHGQRAWVVFQNGEERELYVHLEMLSGVDLWGGREVHATHVARVEFLETEHPTVLRCPNGHVWGAHNEFRFCPYDSQPLTPYERY